VPNDSLLTCLQCPECETTLDADRIQHLCQCGSPLLARYDLERARRTLDPRSFRQREPSLWRYRELLPVRDAKHVVTLGEGWTPLLALSRLGAQLGLPHLLLKDEGLNPTGTFKSRGAAVGVSRARELGVRRIAMPTAGNAGGAWAAYCAAAGIEFVVAMPADAPAINQKEASVCGARVVLVDGLISDAGRLVAQGVARWGWYDASTLKEPYRIEGKKTMGYEIAEQLGWTLPDAVLYPAGGGVGLIGLWKAFDEMEALGWIGRERPRLIAVQAEGCAPLVRALVEGVAESRFWEGASTIAAGLRVPKPLGDRLALRAMRETGGTAVAVSDAAILDAMALLARTEGLFVCPEGAALVAALPLLIERGAIRQEDRVVLLNTGTGLKYPELVEYRHPTLRPDEDIARALA